jgi:hypothetical protein
MALFLNSTPFTSTPLTEERSVDGVALTIPGSRACADGADCAEGSLAIHD